MTDRLSEHLTVTSELELPGAAECRARLERFLGEHPGPEDVFISLAQESGRSGSAATLRAGGFSRNLRVRKETRRALQELSAATGLRAGMLLRCAIQRGDPGGGQGGRDPRTLNVRIGDDGIALEYDPEGGHPRRFLAAMREWFDIGWDRGCWRVRSAKPGAILAAVEVLGREHFLRVGTKGVPPPQAPAAAGSGDAPEKVAGTVVIRPGWDDEILVETPKRSPTFAKAIKRMNGRWDGSLGAWRVPSGRAGKAEALARRCYGNVEIRTG
ncbi:MAG: hypothetical protein OXQ29_19455 [Rhodospirillaceae bacterium]|nr:hypothetical protein [Rhodospirillaceae bacterium]